MGRCLSVIFTSSSLLTMADSSSWVRRSDSPLASTSGRTSDKNFLKTEESTHQNIWWLKVSQNIQKWLRPGRRWTETLTHGYNVRCEYVGLWLTVGRHQEASVHLSAVAKVWFHLITAGVKLSPVDAWGLDIEHIEPDLFRTRHPGSETNTEGDRIDFVVIPSDDWCRWSGVWKSPGLFLPAGVLAHCEIEPLVN